MKKITKTALGALAVVALTATAAIGATSLKAKARLHRHFETHRIDLAEAPPSPEALARGKHLVEARYGCVVCHGTNFGGGVMMDDAAMGSIHGPNLTRGKGGLGASYTMADWDRIVRHGVKPDGTPAVMPSDDYFGMSDEELTDIVAYVRSLPPVDSEVATPTFGPIGTALIAFEKFPLAAENLKDHSAPHPSAPPAEADTAAFGEHLAATCKGCHRANFAGGKMPFGPPSWPAAKNLTKHESGLGTWTFEDFDKALTEGTSKDGHAVLAPMKEVLGITRAMTSTERRALYTYFGTLAPLPTNP